jgi:hypothetical protein
VHIDRATRTVSLSRIFDWYGQDFVATATADVPGIKGKRDASVQFVAGYLPKEEAAWLMAGGYAVSWAEYSWKVNAR